MTIYKPKQQEKKGSDAESMIKPVVVTDVESGHKKPATNVPSLLFAQSKQRKRLTAIELLVGVAGIFLFTTGVIGTFVLYKHLKHGQSFQGVCGVDYVDITEDRLQNGEPIRHVSKGRFDEDVYIDGDVERIQVPAFDECREAEVLHDFSKEYTAIIDRDKQRCFILPLNKKFVKPPQDLYDLLRKLKTGYYIPNAQVVRQTYRVVLPPVTDFSPYGAFITRDCSHVDTYLLAKQEYAPVALAKRSADCEFDDIFYSLGLADDSHVGKLKLVC